jgi:hypothetical protein
MPYDNPLAHFNSVINVVTLTGTARLNDRPPKGKVPPPTTADDPSHTLLGPSVYWLGIAYTTPSIPLSFLVVVDAGAAADALEVGRVGLWGCTLQPLVGECELTFFKRQADGSLIETLAAIRLRPGGGDGCEPAFDKSRFESFQPTSGDPTSGTVVKIRAVGGVCILKADAPTEDYDIKCVPTWQQPDRNGNPQPRYGVLACPSTRCPSNHLTSGNLNPFPLSDHAHDGHGH